MFLDFFNVILSLFEVGNLIWICMIDSCISQQASFHFSLIVNNNFLLMKDIFW